jgi:transcriptional regulator with XRE-family HTH domain
VSKRTTKHDSPYHPLLISARIQRALDRYGKTRTDLAGALGISLSAVSQKFSQNRNEWHLPDLQAVHHYLAEAAGRPLCGFPFLDEALVDRLDQWLTTRGADRAGGRPRQKLDDV